MSSLTAYPSAARTATPTAVQFAVPRGTRFIRVVIDATAVTATPSVVMTLDVLDSASGKWVNLLTGAAIATVSTNTYLVGIGVTAAANAAANVALGDFCRLTLTHGDADSITYTGGVTFIK